MQSVDTIIPIYNEKPDLILVTVKSLNSQTYHINRIFLVDDGSRQPTDFASIGASSRIPVEGLRLNSNSGISAARNYGMHQSRADLLLFVNTGIELGSEWVEKTASFLSAHPEAGLACGRVTPIDTGLRAKWRDQFLESSYLRTDQTHEISWATGHAVMVVARHLRQLGGWNEQMRLAHEDVDLCQRLYANGLKIYQVKGALAFCYDRYTIRMLATKTIRNCGWSLDPSYPGDASLRRLEFVATLKGFVSKTWLSLVDNLKKLRLALVPIDLCVFMCGLYLITQSNIRRLHLRSQ